ncbi:acyl-CoA dehydrogenase family protein [Sphingobium sp. HBC34]|uniref:Acyl-CoA dehydrogenase family protein n=1 Tax=Sphingobium cyanobacteriorum TaxID=3063954 RepID=A0ABT8ZQ86_9SPHN|nr:acyl-CoA dehydrogenase family protein [Sphingobium sp. HBC34]MDO7836715.1 acyl-CoA dehydrogenase family protein [Sphingobium sp. HBC34]
MDDAMDLGALQDSIRDMLTTECPRERVVRHAQHGNGIDRDLWSKAIALGWTMISIPEENGGLGLGTDALALLYEEAGRAAAPLPLLSCLLAVQSIVASASPAQRDSWLPRIAEGAIVAMDAPIGITSPGLSLSRTGGDIVLTGTVRDLLDGADAQLLLLTAADAEGRAYRIMLDVAADDLTIHRETLWDRGRSLSNITLDGLKLSADRAWLTTSEAEEALVDHAAIALAADSVGGQDALLDLTIEYLKTRQQFGRPIGSFQALKHRVADHRTRLEGARWLTRSAVAAVTAGLAHHATEASAAKAQAAADYIDLGRDAIQLHGGIGFTAEYPCHVFVKRAFLNEQLFGSRTFHLNRAAAPALCGAV